MPKVGVDPNGVMTGDATRLPNAQVATTRIRYNAGARTVWHSHAGPQLVFVQEGRGRVQMRGQKIVELRAGEILLMPANVSHWHGAAPDASATLLQIYPVGVNITLEREVTESEYLGKN